MFDFALPTQTSLRQAVTDAYRRDETEAVQDMLQRAQMSDEERQAADTLARRLVTQVRASRTKASGVDALMHEFSLSSEEGVALMCLAEALLRIPDKATRNKLIADKLSDGNWKKHLNNSPSLFVNAAAWGLLITGKLTTQTSEQSLGAALNRLLGKGGEPLIRKGVDYAMRLLGKQFVTGQTIEEALQNGKEREKMGYRYSFDMLGEAAYTQADADRYYNDYVQAIHAIGKDAAGQGVYEGNGISVKLSAIHPRYSRAQHERVMGELLPRLKELYLLGKKYNIGINIDAEEANRLELSLDLMEALVSDPDLAGYNGIGFVVQAYQKRCPFVIDYLIGLARRNNQKLMIRLVKGAYWDSEIKWAQVDGLNGYPVYTRKVHTDISYLACARKLLSAQDAVFPQFATHNAYTLAAIYQMGKGKDFEHQCLHGMGETLYDQVVGPQNLGRRVRIYAPVDTHETLLAYLVRRLLENGANSSFVSQIVDEKISIDQLIRSPFDTIAEQGIHLHAALPLPRDLYGKGRLNSQGFDLSNENVLQQLQQELNRAAARQFQTASVVNGKSRPIGAGQQVRNPADHSDVVGSVSFADAALAAGNTVVAKPAEQTSLIAGYAVSLMHEAGIPTSALQLVLGAGDVGAALTQDPRIGGVIFTGSTEVARLINQTLAKRDDSPVLIAETGGQNAMIVDSTALAEQVCADVLNSAFDSAGQRCSALRILCVQEDVADHMVKMIKGAMDELVVGNPIALDTDIGPVIDTEAQQNLLAHINRMKGIAKSYHEIRPSENVNPDNATFVAPIMFELNGLGELQREVFGPVLHVVRYPADGLDKLIDQINGKGYALTHGVHSRIDGTVEHIRSRIESGNVYVNRNIVGAVVGVQPFGGHGLSGTGPKAGGSFYLQRLSRLKEWTAPTLSKIGQVDEDALKRLETLLHGLPLPQSEKMAAAASLGQSRVRTLRKAESVLAGPTGERNVLSWHAPARVWLYGGSLAASFTALVSLASAGVQAVVLPDHPLAAYADRLDGLLVVTDKPEAAGISHVAALEPLPSARKQVLANRDGALVRILPSENGLDILQVFEEISCSINTTAAGGNASLMAMAD